MGLERWTKPKLSRRMCTCEYGLQSCREKSAGVAKRPRELISPTRTRTASCELLHRNPNVTIRNFFVGLSAYARRGIYHGKMRRQCRKTRARASYRYLSVCTCTRWLAPVCVQARAVCRCAALRWLVIRRRDVSTHAAVRVGMLELARETDCAGEAVETNRLAGQCLQRRDTAVSTTFWSWAASSSRLPWWISSSCLACYASPDRTDSRNSVNWCVP